MRRWDVSLVGVLGVLVEARPQPGGSGGLQARQSQGGAGCPGKCRRCWDLRKRVSAGGAAGAQLWVATQGEGRGVASEPLSSVVCSNMSERAWEGAGGLAWP